MDDWIVEASSHSLRTTNPIHDTLSQLQLPLEFHKPTYSLTVGDPTLFIKPHPVLTECVNQQLLEGKGNGYVNSAGPLAAREAIARRFSYQNITLNSQDVIMDVGGMGAIHTLIHAFVDEGDNILIPSPGFTLFRTVAQNIGADAKLYRLLPDHEWEVDLGHLEELVDERTRLLVVVNPSNPCGTIFSREHCLSILAWAKRHHLCVLADEVYDRMTFGKPYYPLGSLTDDVPVFTVAALSKNFLVPGWRCGWILVYDKYNQCEEIRTALWQVKNMLLHGVPFISNALPSIFEGIPEDYTASLMKEFAEKAELVFEKLQSVPCLKMYKPDGVFYAYVRVESRALQGVGSSVEFARQLAKEEGVLVVPAESFMSEDGFRITLFNSKEVLEECCLRIAAFCEAHRIG